MEDLTASKPVFFIELASVKRYPALASFLDTHYLCVQTLDGALIHMRREPLPERALTTKAVACAQSGMYLEAMNGFDAALNANPGYVPALAHRGSLWLSQGRFNEAIADLTAAVNLNPGVSDLYYGRGTAFAAMGKLDEAISDYGRAIRLNPKGLDVYQARAIAYYRQNNLDRALADVRLLRRAGYNIEADVLRRLE